jgi:lipopolysaccharide/colanic/teichoic acid biosynthesis glycosyltransferase
MIQTIPLELPAEQTEWLFTFVQMRRAAQNAMSARYCFAKRVLHIFGSGLLLMLLFVPRLIVALMVKMTSPSLDEFPQLINPLRGEMSLVGPRPIVEADQLIYGDHMQYYTLVRPGMTGLW